MRVATFNVNGLAGSESAVHQAWKVLGLDLLCLVETWLRPSDEVHIGLPYDLVSLEGPQKGRPHGGIVFLRRPDLETRVLAKYATSQYQILAIYVKPGLNVIGVYIKPNAEHQSINECLARLKSLCRGPTVFMGVWNAIHRDWDEKTNKQGRIIRNWLLQWNLTLRAPTQQPTYLTPYGQSTVDFFISCRVRVHNVGCQIGSWDSASDHSLVSGVIEWTPVISPVNNKRISKAMLKNSKLLEKAKNKYRETLPVVIEEIGNVATTSELDDACQRFADILKEPFESSRCARPDRYRFFWDHYLDYLAKLRSKHYRNWKRRRNMNCWRIYKELDKVIKRTCRNKKRVLLDEFSSPATNEAPSEMTKRVNTLVKLRANRAASAVERGNSLDPAAYTEYVQKAQPQDCDIPPQQFILHDGFEQELATTIRCAPKARATGPDGVANEMLQLCPELCAKALHLLWKACGTMAYLPRLWREGTLCPQHKKGRHDDPANYRGLTLLSHARKHISATINRLVLEYVEFHDYQHGFTKYNGTEQAVVEVCSTVANYHKFVAVLDLKKSYDLVSRLLLAAVCERRLTKQHVKMTSLLLQPMLVRTSKDITDTTAIVRIGVPQGESYSCTLFNLFQDTLLNRLSSVPSQISDKAACAFADDVILMSKTVEGLQTELDICTTWSQDYKMEWNTSLGKSEVLLPPRGHPTPMFYLSGAQLQNVESSEYLGVSMTTSGVTADKHVKRVKAAQRLV